MNNSVEEALQTSVEEVSKDVLVFSTNKTLNQRFSNFRPSTIVLTNGFTRPYKNNRLTRRVVFGYRPSIKISNRFSSYKSENVEEKTNDFKNRRKEQLLNVGKRRRVVMEPTKAGDEKSTEVDTDGNGETNIKGSTPKRFRRANVYRRWNHVPTHSDNLADEKAKEYDSRDEVKSKSSADCGEAISDQDLSKEPIIFSAFHFMSGKYRKSLYSWNRGEPQKESMHREGRLITKEDLDTDIDTYMAEANSIHSVQPTDDEADSFVKEYMMEVDKYSNTDAYS